MVKREVVGAHYGLRDWLAQRVTAVIMVVYTVVILSAVAGLPKLDYWQWLVLWQAPLVRYATVLFMASLLIHAWVGVRNIFMDYIQDAALRLTLYVLVIGALAWYAVWTVQLLWSLNGAAG
jgi:succinate dehydrogenase / fumarate reductase membrane anchor subunit